MDIEVIFLEEAEQFIDELDEKTRQKVLSDMRKTKAGLKGDWFKKLKGTDDIWEFRTLFKRTYYRIFAFWHRTGEKKTLIVCTHGLIKTTDKTPSSDINRAEKTKQGYQG
jgi:phage-related protein